MNAFCISTALAIVAGTCTGRRRAKPGPGRGTCWHRSGRGRCRRRSRNR
jgi:hypothetical protein